MPVARGTLLGASVRLVEELASGAMGTVWLADHVALGSQVAVKVLRSTGEEPRSRQRFMREARAAAKLDSPHIVRVFDVGASSDGEPFIVMERLKGRDLKSVIHSDGPLPPARAADLVAQICRGLAHAHERGVLHRDIKPANVFIVEVDDEPFVKLLDFGIAKAGDELDLTESGALLGTPFYMSPEQMVTPEDIDERADLWSVAVIAYVCLTARLPFQGSSVGALSLAVHEGKFEPVSRVDETLPSGLDGFFRRAFAVEPEDRFATATDLAAALAAALGAEPAVQGDPQSAKTAAAARRLSSHNHGRNLAIAFAAALVVGAVAWHEARSDASAPPPEPPPTGAPRAEPSAEPSADDRTAPPATVAHDDPPRPSSAAPSSAPARHVRVTPAASEAPPADQASAASDLGPPPAREAWP